VTDDEPNTICPGCNVHVEPNDPGVLYAVKLERIDALGNSEDVDGIGAYFHDGVCFERVEGWRLKETHA
jgi:hypothetical protein